MPSATLSLAPITILTFTLFHNSRWGTKEIMHLRDEDAHCGLAKLSWLMIGTSPLFENSPFS